jgi:hypothetical protein
VGFLRCISFGNMLPVLTLFCMVCSVFLHCFVFVYVFLLVLSVPPPNDNSIAVSNHNNTFGLCMKYTVNRYNQECRRDFFTR